MSLKETIEQWQSGVEKAEMGRYEEAVDCFTEMSEPGARIYFNIASMFLRLGNLEDAERNLDLCVKKDPHLALGFFQRGCLHLQKKRYDEAMSNFDIALKNLRGNLLIDYKQLGLQYKLYSCEILYNRAYVLSHKGRNAEAREELEKAKKIAVDASESRQRIIDAALENMKAGNSFMPYKLPKHSMVFMPPRHKTEVLRPVNFMGKAKVLSSIVDQDSYTGFAGTQDEKNSRSPSPTPRSRSRSPSPFSHRSLGKSASYPEPPSGRAPRAPKPSIPPPAPNMKIPNRDSSLHNGDARPVILPGRGSSARSISQPTPKVPFSKPQFRPPKPSSAPPPVRRPLSPRGRKLSPPTPQNHIRTHSPVRSPSPRPITEGSMTVKVHYTTTRALRVNITIGFSQLLHQVCKKFDRPDNSLTLWYKKRSGELGEITGDVGLRTAATNLEDGFRLTIWAYDRQESSPELQTSAVIQEVVAIHDYSAQFPDELNFSAGDRIQVTVEINNDWFEGQCHGSTGIFPKSYVRASVCVVTMQGKQ